MSKKRNGKKVTTTVVCKDEIFLWSAFYCNWSGHGNLMTPIRFLFIFVFLCTRSFFFFKKTLPTCFVLSARTTKLLFFTFSFIVHASLTTILTYLNSTDEGPGPKRLETELTDMARRHFCSLPFFYIEHSLLFTLFTFSYRNFVFIIYLFWHTLTARDDARDRDANSSRQMTSLDAIFCRGDKSSSRSLTRCCEKFELDLWASLTINKYFKKMTHFRNAASSHSGLIPLKTACKKRGELLKTIAT